MRLEDGKIVLPITEDELGNMAIMIDSDSTTYGKSLLAFAFFVGLRRKMRKEKEKDKMEELLEEIEGDLELIDGGI